MITVSVRFSARLLVLLCVLAAFGLLVFVGAVTVGTAGVFVVGDTGEEDPDPDRELLVDDH